MGAAMGLTMPFSSAQADRSISKPCVNALRSELTFIPDNYLYILYPLECNLDAPAEFLGVSEHSPIKAGSQVLLIPLASGCWRGAPSAN